MQFEDEEAGEELELKPPSQDAVVLRALCLGAFVMRGEFEAVIHDLADEAEAKKHRDMMDSLSAWLFSEGVIRHLSARERSLFDLPVGSWDQHDIIDAVWRGESLGIMQWALSHHDALPAYDEMFEESAIMEPLNLLGPTKNFVAKSKLLPVETITRARDIAELWHWRSRTTRVQKDGATPPEGWSFENIIASIIGPACESGDIPQPIGGDFPAFGKAYADLSEDEYSLATSIAMERHFALNWLCGYSEDWDETQTDR